MPMLGTPVSVTVTSRTAGNVKCQYFSTTLNFSFELPFCLVAENLARFIFVYLISDHFSVFLLTLGLFTDTGTLWWGPPSFWPVLLSGIESCLVSSLVVGVHLPGSEVITDPRILHPLFCLMMDYSAPAAHPESDPGASPPWRNLSQMSDPSWILIPSPPCLFFLSSSKSSSSFTATIVLLLFYSYTRTLLTFYIIQGETTHSDFLPRFQKFS